MVPHEDPNDARPIRCRWRRTWKTLPGGGRKPKSRFLVCATNDSRNVETTTYMPSPAVRRALMIYGLSQGWGAATIDVQTAFLLVPLPKDHGDIFVRLPKNMPECATALGYRGGGVYKLRKSLYGLKESPLLFNTYLEQTLRPLGWRRVLPGLYLRNGGQGVLGAYVDDIIVLSPQPQED